MVSSVFDEVVVCRFWKMPVQSESLFANDGPRRIPYKVLTGHNFTGAEWPYIHEHDGGVGGYTTRGLHDHSTPTGGNNTGTVIRHLHGTYRTGGDLISWIQVRLVNGQSLGVAPATRITFGGDKCYAAEFTWSASGWKATLYRYDTPNTTSPSAIGATALNFILPNPSSTPTLWALGIIAVTNPANVSVTVYAQPLTSVAGFPGPFGGDLMDITKSINPPPTGPTKSFTGTDTNALRLTAQPSYTGFKWKYQPTALPANVENRLCMAWGAFQLIGATQPVTPALVLTSSEGTKISAVASGFFDSDSSDTHVMTRWLLYEATPGFELPYPIVDTDFQPTNLNSYTFEDLAPGKVYAVRCQFLDNDVGGGDISPLSGFYHAKVLGQPHWYISGLNFIGRSAGLEFPRNLVHEFHDPATAPAQRVWQFVDDGIGLGAVGPVITRMDRVDTWTQPFRRIVYRDPDHHSTYDSIHATMVFVKWPGDTKLRIGARTTISDNGGFYVRKVPSGSDYIYHVEHRALIGTDPNSVNPADWTNTPVMGPFTVPISSIGKHGERIILASTNLGDWGLSLYVNGMLIGTVSGASVHHGVTDLGHEYSCLMMEDGPFADFLIQQYGQIGGIAAFPIKVTPSQETHGTGMHHPGPFMDPFDSGNDFAGIPNVWFMGGGKFRFRTASPSGDVAGLGFLIYWAPQLPSWDYAVKSKFYNGCGPVVRFSDTKNYIAITVTNVIGGVNYVYTMAVIENGVLVSLTDTTVTDPNYATTPPEIVCQVANNAFNLGQIYLRVYYNGEPMLWSGFGENVHIELSPSSPLMVGRFGVVRSQLGVPGNDLPVCEAIECYAGIGSAAPNAPTLETHDNEASVKISFRLLGSAFSDPDEGAGHTASEWEVYRHPAGTLLWKSGTDVANLTAITITPSMGSWTLVGGEVAGFDTNTAYKARVRYRDNLGLWSPWSVYHQFTTSLSIASNVSIQNLPSYPREPLVSQTFEETVQFNTLISLSESGKEQRRAKWTVPRRLFKLRYDIRIQAEIDVIWSFYRTVGFGRLNLFNFTDPRSGVTYVCRFLEDGLTRELIEFQIENAGLSLIEVPV